MASNIQEVDVLESWEDIDETDVLEQKFKALLPSSRPVENSSYSIYSCNGNLNGTQLNIILTGEDALRTQYVPPEPTVKILKRPTKGTQVNYDSRSFQPKKTLQQREQEYAQARLRILGEAHSPEKTEEKVSSIQIKSTRSVEVDNVIRLPKGPDGTKGFNVRR